MSYLFFFGKYELDQCRCGTSDPFFAFVISGVSTLFTTLASTPTLFPRSICLIRQDHIALDSACTQKASAAAWRSPIAMLDRICISHRPGSKPCPISLELNEPASSIERLNQAGPGAMASVLTEPTHILPLGLLSKTLNLPIDRAHVLSRELTFVASSHIGASGPANSSRISF